MPKQTNILFLMTDQHRWNCLGIHNPIVKTPNLDQLARRGVLFSNAICNNPMCVPSRYSMMTGLYSSQTGVRHNTQMCPAEDDMVIPTLVERLRELGYQTAGFGKMHWYINPPEDPDPTKLVFRSRSNQRAGRRDRRRVAATGWVAKMPWATWDERVMSRSPNSVRVG